ncbi:Integral membrane protein [Tritrichomonas foetus]|uniref:Integral membrane protein n=1 Tax=Tritrichomonas foetus TaxID=1144522 RepID=A0A1J4K263_9EUKA|nr:Integral membrane protein [Tritrichomonas foetus]|eukprot:OHT05479.1 Integral membrane protein [Tritrichomonas foetus]
MLWYERAGAILGFISLCFLYGTSYGIAMLGLETYPGATLTALRMIYAFATAAIILGIRFTFEIRIRLNIIESLTFHKMDILKSLFGGIIYYGFPHSLIGVCQRTIPSNTIHIAQSCVPFFASVFANFMLKDEKFSFKKFYPQIIALIGTILTTLPTFSSSYAEKPSALDYIFMVVGIASFGFGSVYMKSGLASCEPTLCGFFQLFVSAVYSLLFALAWDKPSLFVESINNSTFVSMLWPLILGIVHTCGCTYIYLWTVKKLGAVITSFSNFGQIAVGILIGVFFFKEWVNYKTKDYILSYVGLAILVIAIICGFWSDREKNDTYSRLNMKTTSASASLADNLNDELN